MQLKVERKTLVGNTTLLPLPPKKEKVSKALKGSFDGVGLVELF